MSHHFIADLNASKKAAAAAAAAAVAAAAASSNRERGKKWGKVGKPGSLKKGMVMS